MSSRWVVLFFAASNLGRAKIYSQEFAKRNVKCLAHCSCDIDCVNDTKSNCLDIPQDDFPYPIIADPDRYLPVEFGMLDEHQRKDPEVYKTCRAFFIISPDHKLRLSMSYPMSISCSVDEILRCIDALQLIDHRKVVATPANCTPGTQMMTVPSVSNGVATKLIPNGFFKVYMPSGFKYVRNTENY